MSHLLHHTKAYILSSQNYGESNRLYRILTPEYGLLLVAAQGVRQLHSKLRYHLQEFVELRLTLVRGREIWRITGAEQYHQPFSSGDHLKRGVVKRISALLCRMVPDEERSPELFAHLQNLLVVLGQEELNPTELYHFELATALSILNLLGYVPAASVPSSRHEVLPAQAVMVINQALHHSML